MSAYNQRHRAPREISDSQRSMLTQMHGDADVSRVLPEIMGFYRAAVAGEPVTQRQVQRIVDAFKEHQRAASELPLTAKQLYWVEKRSGEAAAEAAEQLTRDQFPRLVLEALAQTYGTDDFDELLERPVDEFKAWANHLVGGTALIFGASQRERQLTLIKAAGTPDDIKAPMKRLHQDLVRAAKRAAGEDGPEA